MPILTGSTSPATRVTIWLGYGPHMCAGMNLARIEMELMLEALGERAARLEVGAPVADTNSGLFGFTNLPFRID